MAGAGAEAVGTGIVPDGSLPMPNGLSVCCMLAIVQRHSENKCRHLVDKTLNEQTDGNESTYDAHRLLAETNAGRCNA